MRMRRAALHLVDELRQVGRQRRVDGWALPVVEVVRDHDRWVAQDVEQTARVVVDLLAQAGGDDRDIGMHAAELALDKVGRVEHEDFVAGDPD